ncbi:DUF3343 domain-containing protein [uncultured Anaerococcus sp.]|uniref:DUF3343 domain-containing protein n=1 Tax=uncultured Anaerococcus sp. TaxID=293428 RepID=UPI002805EE14|nr:DUF3343 domain-containing protein [uncultured Anaerococcus sp.]MDU2585167.1 DUF3343 domain-containing protein [Anaerococcus prevotii]
MIVITFDTTTDAMMMESFAKENKLAGKVIPLPNEISAGCGLAFKIETEDLEKVTKTLEENSISYEKIHKLGVDK